MEWSTVMLPTYQEEGCVLRTAPRPEVGLGEVFDAGVLGSTVNVLNVRGRMR
jgi:hypothetical protein